MNLRRHAKAVDKKLIAAAALLTALPAFAALGLSIRFTDMVMEQVPLGMVLNFRQEKNIPYMIMNKTDGPVDVAVDPEVPTKEAAKEGYEPALSPGWIKVIPNHFHLEKGDVASADVVLSVPKDRALVGRHFQLNLHAHTQGTGFLAVGVLHTIRLSIAAPGPDALKHDAALKDLEKIDFDMVPQSFTFEKVPLGKKVHLNELNADALKLSNRGEGAVKLSLKSVKVDESFKNPDYESAPDPAWLTVAPEVLKVKANGVGEVNLYLEIPDAPANRGRKFMFIVRGDLEGKKLPVAIQSRVYVVTEGPVVDGK